MATTVMNGNDCFKNDNDCSKWQRPFTKGKIAAKSACLHDYKAIYFLETLRLEMHDNVVLNTTFFPNIKITDTQDVSVASWSFFILFTKS